MSDYVLGATVFANLALLFYVLGLLARRETWLRINLLFGTGFYILYYYNVTDSPLWDAIMASLVIGAANLWSITRLMLDRSTIGMTAERRALYQRFPTLSPGQFRRMMRIAQTRRTTTDVVICEHGKVPEGLYFLISGDAVLRRDNRETVLLAGQFVGEISFMRGPAAPATATAILKTGAEYVVWDRATLGAMMHRSASFANALGALFNRDLSDKLATSWPDR